MTIYINAMPWSVFS